MYKPIHLGGEDCLQPLNMRMFHYARGEAQQLLPVDVIDTDLWNTCNELVSHVFSTDMASISSNSCFDIYKYLVNNLF